MQGFVLFATNSEMMEKNGKLACDSDDRAFLGLRDIDKAAGKDQPETGYKTEEPERTPFDSTRES